jgi:hypothetical protein
VCRYLSVQVDARGPAAQILAQLMPALQSLHPHATPIPWQTLLSILQELIDVVRQLKVEKDIYAPYFPLKGSPRTYCFELTRGSRTGDIVACTFPGMTKRAWDDQNQRWYATLLAPAYVELDNIHVG